MKIPETGELVFAEGIQNMDLTPIMVLVIGNEQEGKWGFTGKRIYPGSIDNVTAFLYASKQLAEEDEQPANIAKCWRKENSLNNLIDDLVVALAKFQSTL